MAPRILSNMDYEQARAILALAGIREEVQAVHTATAGASTAYTVTGKNTRRVICIHFGAGNTDIRFRYNAAAAATNLPVLPATYFSVDADKDKTLNFYNTTGSNISISVMEVA